MRTTAVPHAVVRPRRPYAPPPGLVPAVLAGVLDLMFVVGVRHGPDGRDEAWSAWLGLPAIWLAVTLPLLLYVAVVVVLADRSHPTNRFGLHPLQTATVALAVVGVGIYLSPWGRHGVVAILET